jgi:hypothetical protein
MTEHTYSSTTEEELLPAAGPRTKNWWSRGDVVDAKCGTGGNLFQKSFLSATVDWDIEGF